VASTGKVKKIDLGKKEVHDSNNARNRDAFSITKSNNILEYISSNKGLNSTRIKGIEDFGSTNPNETEDVLITLIDLKKELE
jgi:hypothetical protein